jgi:hypothetical protein
MLLDHSGEEQHYPADRTKINAATVDVVALKIDLREAAGDQQLAAGCHKIGGRPVVILVASRAQLESGPRPKCLPGGSVCCTTSRGKHEWMREYGGLRL